MIDTNNDDDKEPIVATQAQLADFIGRRLSIGRLSAGAGAGGAWSPWSAAPLSSHEQVAAELLADAEFEALQLGTFLNTPTGEFVEEAVALAVPPAFAPEYTIVVDALKLAAKLQQGRARANAVLTAAAALCVGLLLREAHAAT